MHKVSCVINSIHKVDCASNTHKVDSARNNMHKVDRANNNMHRVDSARNNIHKVEQVKSSTSSFQAFFYEGRSPAQPKRKNESPLTVVEGNTNTERSISAF
ncbi:hypothetical protein CDAR_272871 [Caerostris darwini]|uniref:Uncharacterized protein n=1 Tax=Caerostris darwini TaxID=1538125 RepID=A0AAV4MFI8_9ARAC|nr:hypothetical protein CDAR_272871 [Caerostris darwini]